jgi:hypothetical protein
MCSGFSYGTVLGATFAALFPVRRSELYRDSIELIGVE